MKKERTSLNSKPPVIIPDEAQDKYNTLRDENLQLKSRHKQLEESIKIIAVKLKR